MLMFVGCQIDSLVKNGFIGDSHTRFQFETKAIEIARVSDPSFKLRVSVLMSHAHENIESLMRLDSSTINPESTRSYASLSFRKI
jgi:hypothetical protein